MSLLLLLFPAAAANSMSLSLARRISSRSACENPPPPQLLESTRTLAPAVSAKAALACTTNSMALIAPSVVPDPPAFRNLAPMILAVQFTPATPMLLFPTAPMVPEQCVPWLLSSSGLQVLLMALKPCVPAAQLMVMLPMVTVKSAGADQMLAARSG